LTNSEEPQWFQQQNVIILNGVLREILGNLYYFSKLLQYYIEELSKIDTTFTAQYEIIFRYGYKLTKPDWSQARCLFSHRCRTRPTNENICSYILVFSHIEVQVKQQNKS